SVEVFAGDDVGRRLRPVLRHVHIFLAEDGYTLFVSDQRCPLFPLYGVEWRNLPVGEEALKLQPCGLNRRARFRCFALHNRLHRCCHSVPPSAGIPVRCGGTLILYSFAVAKLLRLLSYCFQFTCESLAHGSSPVFRLPSTKRSGRYCKTDRQTSISCHRPFSSNWPNSMLASALS